MLIRIPFLREAAEIVQAQHELFDGTGYPRGLKGEASGKDLFGYLNDWGPCRK